MSQRILSLIVDICHASHVICLNFLTDKLELQMNIENVLNSQGVLNDIASRYLKSVEPSDRKEFGDFKQYLTDIRKILIVDIRQGSLIITVRCISLQILDELWEGYCSGHPPK